MSIQPNILETYKKDPRSFRRTIVEYGLFARLPIEGSDDLRREEVTRMRYFWRWVIDRAVIDVIESYRVTREYTSAVNWAKGNDSSEGKDFKRICEWADLEPSLVQSYFLKIKEAKDLITQGGTIDIYKAEDNNATS